METIAVVLLGLIVGSFITALIERLPDCRGLITGRSRCPHCAQALQARDLVPIVSFLVLKGRCRACGHPIAWVYPAAEIGGLLIAALSAVLFQGPHLWISAGLGWMLLALTLSDLRRFLLPDLLVYPLLLAGLASLFLEPSEYWVPIALERGLGALLGFILLEALRRLYRRLRGRDGLGFGDVKLLAAAGAWLGWPLLPFCLALAGTLGLATVLIMKLCGREITSSDPLPFGAFLAPAIWGLWLVRETLPAVTRGLTGL